MVSDAPIGAVPRYGWRRVAIAAQIGNMDVEVAMVADVPPHRRRRAKGGGGRAPAHFAGKWWNVVASGSGRKATTPFFLPGDLSD